MSTAPLASPESQGGRFRKAILGQLFVPLYLLLQGGAVVAAAFLSWTAWTGLGLTPPSGLALHMRLGFGAALVVMLLTVVRHEHRIDFHLADEHRLQHTMRLWNLAMCALFVTVFLSRRADDLGRGAVVLFYVTGLSSLWVLRVMTTRLLRIARDMQAIVARRIMVVGTRPEIATFLRRHQPWNLGFEVVGSVAVTPAKAGDPPNLDLQLAVQLARELHPDDVYVAVPWSETETIDRCVEAFLTTPIAIHLAPERVLDRFDQVAVMRIGAMASLELTRPMPALAQAAKRAFDLAVSALGLVMLAPLLGLVALAIKLDSRGPVFFLQTRYGFNQHPFRIIKFRTMTTHADSGDVPQATRDDERVTRLGRILRRINFDELPQLVNVLLGQMSLVGPRPHAVPHNRAFERRIDLYARRHNVKPGITGWAQVHGLRGETDTEEKMRRRVEYDLFYIDNWSMLLDVQILLKTVFSRLAYRNAY